MNIILVLGIIFGIFCILFIVKNDKPDGLFIFVFAWLSSGFIMSGTNNKPKAMDVYQGKTTLEITYKDGVPVDSIVVFKDGK